LQLIAIRKDVPETQEALAQGTRLVQHFRLQGTTSRFESNIRANGDLGLWMRMLLLNPYA
jgi:hypothetical protein